MLNGLISHYFAEMYMMYYLAEILFGNNTIQTASEQTGAKAHKVNK